MLIKVLYQVMELRLKLINVVLDLFWKHLLSLGLSATRISNESGSPSKNKDGSISSQSQMIKNKEAHEIADMYTVCCRIDAQIYACGDTTILANKG